MKNKKHGLAAILALALVFTLGGCQKAATPERLLGEMAAKMAKMESCTMDMDMDMKIAASIEGFDMDMDLGMDIDMEVTTEPARVHGNGKLSMDVMGQNVDMDMEMYSLQEDGKNLSYVKIYDTWLKQETEDMTATMEAYTFKDIQELSQSLELADETQTENDKECYVLSGNISGDAIKGMLDTVLSNMSSSGLDMDTDAFADTRLDYRLFIDKEDKYPVKMTMDLKDLMESAMNASQNEVNFTCGGCDFTYVFTGFNTVASIELPDEARESATDMEGLTDGLLDDGAAFEGEDFSDISSELSGDLDDL